MPPKPSDPHSLASSPFTDGMTDALDGKDKRKKAGKYYDLGYKHGLAVLEKEREKKAEEVDEECTSSSKIKQ